MVSLVPRGSVQISARPRVLAGALSLAVLVGGVAACGGDDDGADADGSETTERTQETSSTTAAPSSTTASTRPPAADGTDLGACHDGTCEVQVTVSALPLDIPLDGALGVDVLTLSSITPDGIVTDGVGYGGGVQLHIEVPVGSPGNLNALSVTLVAVDGDAAIVRLAPS